MEQHKPQLEEKGTGPSDEDEVRDWPQPRQYERWYGPQSYSYWPLPQTTGGVLETLDEAWYSAMERTCAGTSSSTVCKPFNGRNLLRKKILCLNELCFLFGNLHPNRQLTHWWNCLSILLLNTILKSRQCQIFDGTRTSRQPPLQRSQTRSNKRHIYFGFSWFSLWLPIAICIHRQPAVLTKSNIFKHRSRTSTATVWKDIFRYGTNSRLV